MSESKVLRGNYSIWAAFPEAPVDWENPSEADITAAVADGLIFDISCAVTDDSGESLNEVDPATDDTQSVCDIATVENPTYRNFAAELDGFRNATGTTDTPFYDTFFSLFNGVGRKYWLVKRVDKRQGDPIEAGDIISAFLFETDYGVDIADDGGLIYFGARFKQQGEIHTNKTVGA